MCVFAFDLRSWFGVLECGEVVECATAKEERVGRERGDRHRIQWFAQRTDKGEVDQRREGAKMDQIEESNHATTS